MSTDLCHAFDCVANGGTEQCLLCLHEEELKTLTLEDILVAIEEIESRWGRYGNEGVQVGFSADVTVEQALAYFAHYRGVMHIGRYRRNAVRCHACGNVAESRHHHDYRGCGCGSVAVDGGTFYLNRTGDGFDSLVTLWPGAYVSELRDILSYHGSPDAWAVNDGPSL